MKTKINYNEKNAAQLNDALKEAREELRALRFNASGARAKNSNTPKQLRATVARILTVTSARAKGIVTTPA
jgi:ribosomal protein L29